MSRAKKQANELSLIILSILLGGALITYTPDFTRLVVSCTWAYAICLGILTIFGDFSETRR
jgi:hypothetical protein